MSPTEQAFWNRVRRRAATLSPDLASSILRAFQVIREELSEAELTRLIAGNNFESVFREVLDDAMLDRSFAQLRVRLRAGLGDATKSFVRDLPRAAKPAAPDIAFNVLNPRVIDGIRDLESRVMTTLRNDVRESVRHHVTAGLQNGVAPKTIAKGIRDVVGLAPNQEQWVRNFRAALEGKEARNPFGYTLRDKRFDAAIRKGNLSPGQVDKMVETYRKRLTAWHAETVARTAALDAQKLGQRLSWMDAIERGVVDRGRLMKRRVDVGDSRVRPMHKTWSGEVRQFDEMFSSGELVPGELEWNCRCVALYFLAPPAGTA